LALLVPFQDAAATNHGNHPAVSPGGKLIAFVSNRSGLDNISVIGADGAGERCVTTSDQAQGGLSWSADRRIVFSAFADGVSRVFSVKPGCVDLHQIAPVSGRCPVLPPDGRRASRTISTKRRASFRKGNASRFKATEPAAGRCGR
jgi:Tol biopolymer transport system component